MSEKLSLEKREIRLTGLPASPGIAIGEVCLYKRERPVVRPVIIENEEAEKQFALFEEGRRHIVRDLEHIRSRAGDEETAEIIGTQVEIVNDPDLESRVKKLVVDELYNVDYAIYEAFRGYIDLIKSSRNSLLKERIIDIEDIRDRLIQVVRHQTNAPKIRDSAIVVTDELTPSEIIQFADRNMKALAMDSGGLTSHTSIIAHSMGLTSVVGTKRVTQFAADGDTLIVDGNEGLVIIRPREETLTEYKKRFEKEIARLREQDKIIQEPSQTQCGQPFKLRANIEFEEEVPNLERFNAAGVGLLRTESLYMSRGHFDDGETQERFYENIVEGCIDETVTIRLFDAGGDKFVEQPFKEANPFLGWRGIRMLLDERDLLQEQLHAVLRVAGRNPGRIKILLPMISSIEEVMEVKEEMLFVQDRIRKEGEPVDEHVKLGVMVEVPSVAIQADAFARHVDFFSIGTNDLTQYTLAVDRGNELISSLYQQTHPAVWRLIRYAVEAAGQAGIDVAVCGEVAADPAAAACLMGMGITDLSMSPASIPGVKNVLINHTLKEMQQLVGRVEQAVTYTEINRIFKDWKQQHD